MQAYNATKNESTGFSPHCLMSGWHPRLSVNAFFGTDNITERAENQSSYAQKLSERLKFAYKAAANVIAKPGATNKERYDGKIRESRVTVGSH